MPLTADLMNGRVIPFFDSHEVKLLRMLTDRGPITATAISKGCRKIIAT